MARLGTQSAASDSTTQPSRSVSMSSFGGGRGWDQLLTAMRLYHENYGDLCIELGWKVPACQPWFKPGASAAAASGVQWRAACGSEQQQHPQ